MYHDEAQCVGQQRDQTLQHPLVLSGSLQSYKSLRQCCCSLVLTADVVQLLLCNSGCALVA